jgi:hypothetical protein
MGSHPAKQPDFPGACLRNRYYISAIIQPKYAWYSLSSSVINRSTKSCQQSSKFLLQIRERNILIPNSKIILPPPEANLQIMILKQKPINCSRRQHQRAKDTKFKTTYKVPLKPHSQAH